LWLLSLSLGRLDRYLKHKKKFHLLSQMSHHVAFQHFNLSGWIRVWLPYLLGVYSSQYCSTLRQRFGRSYGEVGSICDEEGLSRSCKKFLLNK
jgi:hypothetical protein